MRASLAQSRPRRAKLGKTGQNHLVTGFLPAQTTPAVAPARSSKALPGPSGGLRGIPCLTPANPPTTLAKPRPWAGVG